MNEKSGENGKVSHCALSLWRALHHTSPARALLTVQRRKEAFLQRLSFSSYGLRMKMLQHPSLCLKLLYFSSDNIQINSLNPSCI